MLYQVMNTKITFKSSKENIAFVVMKGDAIMAKCSSFDLALKAKAKDERLYPSLQGKLEVVETVKI